MKKDSKEIKKKILSKAVSKKVEEKDEEDEEKEETGKKESAGGPGKFPFQKYGKIKKSVAKAAKGY